MLRIVLAAAAALVTLTIQANARSTPYKADLASEFSGDRYSGKGIFPDVKPVRQEAPRAACSSHGCREAKRPSKRIHGHHTPQIVASVGGCPSIRYCGCATAVKIFGKPIRSLWLASNWLKFPAAAPAPGMIAARHGHVFVIQQVLGNGRVLAWDPNSGGHKTRIHVRSLAGFSVRNPHGSRLAQG